MHKPKIPGNPTAFFLSKHGVPAGDNLLADRQSNIFDVIRRVGKSPVLLQSIALSGECFCWETKQGTLMGAFSRHSKRFGEIAGFLRGHQSPKLSQTIVFPAFVVSWYPAWQTVSIWKMINWHCVLFFSLVLCLLFSLNPATIILDRQQTPHKGVLFFPRALRG